MPDAEPEPAQPDARRPTLAAVALALAAVTGCGSTETRRLELRRVIPAADALCGAPADARTLLVTALGAFPPTEATADSRPVAEGIEFEISSFPAETRILSVQVIGTGGAVRAIGHTAPFDLASLDDGATVPVFMAPQRGFCATGPPAVGRIKPLVAQVAQGVLVAGGTDSAGAPAAGMEQYDPATGRFATVPVDLYADDAFGLIGATMTSVGSDRVLIAGGSQTAYQVLDAVDNTVSAARFLPQARAHHAAVWLGGDTVLLVGGCARLQQDGTCELTSVLATTSIVDLAAERVRVGPTLAGPRSGASVVREADGRVLVVGGIDDSGAAITTAERIDPSGNQSSELLAGVSGVAAPLAGGGSLVSFATQHATPMREATVVPPGATEPTVVASAAAPRAGASVTPLEDGRVLVVGGLAGDAGDEALYYLPSDASFETLGAAPERSAMVLRRRDHAATRLLDGSVFIVGGRDSSGAALADAWIYRPDLTGPHAADVTVNFGDSLLAQQIIPRDPKQVQVDSSGGPPSRLVLTSSGGGALPSEWFVIGGPIFARATATLRMRAVGGGVGLLLWFSDASHHLAVSLAPGQAATVYEVNGGATTVVSNCVGEVIEPTDVQGDFANVSIEARPDSLQVRVRDRTVLTCTGLEQSQPGHVGVGVVGPEGARVEVASITVRR